jgi:hypothetical protein
MDITRLLVLASVWLALYAVFSTGFPRYRYRSFENVKPPGPAFALIATTIAWAVVASVIVRLWP